MSTRIKIGWHIEESNAKFVFFEPTPLFKQRSKPLSNRAVQACPAVNELERDYFVIKNPFDLRLRCIKKETSFDLHVVEEGTRIDDDLLPNFVFLMPPDQWRDRNKPVIQIKVPYFFLCDQPCYMTMLAPYMSPNSMKWPGIMIGGRFPIHVWPRVLNFAFEWCDLEEDLILRRGHDLSYLYFETENLRTSVQLVEMQNTPELQEYRNGISSTPKFMSNTFSLFETAESRRPKKLLVEKKR